MKWKISPDMPYYLKTLESLNFRNHNHIKAEFHNRLNFVVGDNASGKTTLLNGIYYLSFTKGFMGQYDYENIRSGTDFFLLKGEYYRNEVEEVVSCGLKKDGKKQFLRNNKEYDRFFDHIGQFPLVVVSPYDNELIRGNSEERRKFVDGIISQLNRPYLESVMHYSRVLKQRNALLKKMQETRKNQDETLQIYNDQLVLYGEILFKERSAFLKEFVPLFAEIYNNLAGKNEPVNIEYDSSIENTEFGSLLKETFHRDLMLGYTSAGLHRDDFRFTINGLSARTAGSQGQQKTFLLTLRLAQYAYMKSHLNIAPILLLDDIFDKLDDNRVASLLLEVLKPEYGQIFISHTSLAMLEWVLGSINQDYAVIHLKNGSVYEPE